MGQSANEDDTTPYPNLIMYNPILHKEVILLKEVARGGGRWWRVATETAGATYTNILKDKNYD